MQLILDVSLCERFLKSYPILQVYTQPDVNLHNLPLVKITGDFTLLEVKLMEGRTYEVWV